MTKPIVGLLLATLLLGACSSSEVTGTTGRAGMGTATERKLCADLSAGVATRTLYQDADAVNNDLSTGPDDLSLEVLAYMNAVDNLPGSASISRESARLQTDCGKLGR